jgi:hypothetical protein
MIAHQHVEGRESREDAEGELDRLRRIRAAIDQVAEQYDMLSAGARAPISSRICASAAAAGPSRPWTSPTA